MEKFLSVLLLGVALAALLEPTSSAKIEWTYKGSHSLRYLTKFAFSKHGMAVYVYTSGLRLQ